MRAWASQDRFVPGTNLHAWLFTILRNSYFSESRKARRSVEDPDGSYTARLASAPEQTVQGGAKSGHGAAEIEATGAAVG